MYNVNITKVQKLKQYIVRIGIIGRSMNDRKPKKLITVYRKIQYMCDSLSQQRNDKLFNK